MNGNTWKLAARAWWERLNAERAKNAKFEDQLFKTNDCAHVLADHYSKNLARVEAERAELLQKIEELRAQPPSELSGIAGWLRARQSVNAAKREHAEQLYGQFADLAERIAYADGKKPRDLPDGGWGSIRDALQALTCARNTLAENHTWSSALRCEVEEAMYALACGDMDGFVDELRDVQTVAFRCERAVLERGKK